jgi:glycosyltransferase involved in cell wall biosynthesis
MFSIVTPNCERFDHLKLVLPSWQRARLVSEIVVVDYGSNPPIDLGDADKVCIIRVENAHDWRPGHAVNIGFDFATSEQVIRLDSDIILDDEHWIAGIDLAKAFYRGNYGVSKAKLDRAYGVAGRTSRYPVVQNGEVAILKRHWSAVGGYHEWTSGYGFEDVDFYMRLRAAGVEERFIDASFLHAIPHSNDLRGQYRSSYLFGTINDAQTRAGFDQRKNTLLAFMSPWNHSMRAPYTVV